MREAPPARQTRNIRLQEVLCCWSARDWFDKLCVEQVETNDYDESDEEVITDPEFLQSVLQSLPGVDPQSEAVRQAMSELTQPRRSNANEKTDDSSKKEESKWTLSCRGDCVLWRNISLLIWSDVFHSLYNMRTAAMLS